MATPGKASADQLFTLEPLVAFLIELLLGGHTTGSGQAPASKSVPADATNEIDNNFAGKTGPCAFNLGDDPVAVRADFAKRLRELVLHPERFDQRQLNACGSAAFFHVWLRRDPLAAAKYAMQLFNDGQGAIGSLTVKASAELRAQSYRLQQVKFGENNTPPSPDWVMLSALRDGTRATPRFLGIPDSDNSNNQTGFVHPQELCDWLLATGVYRSAVNNAGVFGQRDFGDYTNPLPDDRCDVFMLMHARLLLSPNQSAEAACHCESIAGTLKGLANLGAMVSPDHYVVLEDFVQVTDGGANVNLTFWCWADTYRTTLNSLGKPCCMPYKVDFNTFQDNFYGAVIAIR